MEYTMKLPKSLIKRVENFCLRTRQTPQQFIKKALENFLAYEEHKLAEIKAAEADFKDGRVHSKDEFWDQLEIAKHERKKIRTKSA